ncbi:MAG: glycosyltransferase family 4 protein [Bdellovibrionales bacterium]|nr:glycosyltransferase family 4 protein [Bdellovibrionales bacterium]
MKFLFVNQTFYPDPSATAQYLTDVAVELAESGHDVTVLTSARGYVDPYDSYESEQEFHRVKIKRVWAPYIKSKLRFFRFINAVSLNFSFALWLLFAPRFDKVVALTSPPLVAFVARFIGWRPNTNFVYWIMDLNPDQAIAAKWMRKNGIAARTLEWALKLVLRQSDQVIVLDESMKERIRSRGVPEDKISILSLWMDNERLKPISREDNPFREKYDLEDKFVVMYSGNMSLCHPLDTILDAARLMRPDSNLKFVFIGAGERLREVEAYRKKYKLENIICLPHQPRSELKYSLSAGDLHVVTLGEEFVGVVHPSKVYGILAVERPAVLIGPSKSPIGRVFQEHPGMRQVDHGDLSTLISTIEETRNAIESLESEIHARAETTAKEFGKEQRMKEFLSILCTKPTKPDKPSANDF